MDVNVEDDVGLPQPNSRHQVGSSSVEVLCKDISKLEPQ